MISSYNTFLPLHYVNFILFCPQQMTEKKIDLEEVQKTESALPDLEGIKLGLTVEDLLQAGYHNDRTPWTEKEDALLSKLGNRNDMTWIQIAQRIPHRTAKMCYSRFRRIANQTKARWTAKEDQTIRELVEAHGENWPLISDNLPGRSAKQLEQHYSYCLKPEINKSEWTLQEDLQLIQLLEKWGKNWQSLQKNMRGRTQHQIKNRYFGRLKKLQERKQNKAEEVRGALV